MAYPTPEQQETLREIERLDGPCTYKYIQLTSNPLGSLIAVWAAPRPDEIEPSINYSMTIVYTDGTYQNYTLVSTPE